MYYSVNIKKNVDIPLGKPPDRGFDHLIELEEWVHIFITSPYYHPKVYKYKIKKSVKELLQLGHIFPSSSAFSSSVVMAKKNDGTLRMCIDY